MSRILLLKHWRICIFICYSTACFIKQINIAHCVIPLQQQEQWQLLLLTHRKISIKFRLFIKCKREFLRLFTTTTGEWIVCLVESAIHTSKAPRRRRRWRRLQSNGWTNFQLWHGVALHWENYSASEWYSWKLNWIQLILGAIFRFHANVSLSGCCSCPHASIAF